MRKRVRLGWLLLGAAACGLGWLLFVVHLDNESLWYDEWFTWEYSRQGPIALVNATAGDVHPPAYYLWVWGWMLWTQSDDLFVMRLSSAIPAVLSVAMCYRVGADWFRSRWVGLAAAVFLATSGIFVYYARELRMYTLVVLMGLGSWWLLWRSLKPAWGVACYAPTSRQRSWYGYAALVGLMAYTYYFTAFMAAMQALAALLVAPRRWPRLALAYGAALVAFAPWLPALYRQLVLESERAGRGSTVSLTNVGKFAATQATSWETVNEFVHTYSAQQPAYVLFLLALAFMLGARRRPFTITVLWFFGTLLLFWGVNLVIPVYALRYTLMIVPALALLVGAAVERLPARVGLVAVIGCLGVVTHSAAFLEPKTPHRELMQTLSANYRPGDRIWYNLDYGALGSSLEFERGYHLEHDAPNLSTDLFVWDAPHDFEAAPRVWDVRPYWIPMPDDARDALLAGRALSEEYRFGAYFVRLYEAPPREQPIIFDGRLALLVAPLSQSVYYPGHAVRLKTWWRALEGISLDYSYGLYLRGADGAILAQSDQGLEVEGKPTSQWQPSDGDGLALSTLTLPPNLAPGEYSLWLSVYYWEDARPLTVSAPPGFVVDAQTPLVRVAQLSIE
jgi:hypothetical protein